MARDAALAHGVCVRPVAAKVTDTDTGHIEVIPIACGATRDSKCPPCADRARRLRMHQCREGWHLDHEPEPPDPETDPDTDDDEEPAELGRRVRSTRRRGDAPDLPSRPLEDRTLGPVFTSDRDGKTWRPSMFLTVTLPSYGRVRGDGAPVDPETYDYRSAALDALHFPKLVDRLWQNLRRAVGWKVQYFAAIEAQRRLAPHLHAAVRGAIPRELFHQAQGATYHQVWWPAHVTPVYVAQLPKWDDQTGGYIDPVTRRLLPSWEQALDALDADPEAEPAHVLRFGDQADIQGVIAGTPVADRLIGYCTKYLTKSIADTYNDPDQAVSPARAAHIDRLAEEVRWLPCSERCANWLRYGIQPHQAGPGLTPGYCRSKAHDRENLGLGGRRVLVSRRWTGKTLAGHRADRAAVVRAALEEAGIDPDDHDEFSVSGSDGKWQWQAMGRAGFDDRTYAHLISHQIATRDRWRTQYETAKARAGPVAAGRSVTGHMERSTGDG